MFIYDRGPFKVDYYKLTGKKICMFNRENSQLKRGGAFYCINSSGLHNAFRKLITCKGCVDSCPSS
jgi:hypothetical protein